MMLAALTDATRAIVYGLFSKKNAKQPEQFVEALRRKQKKEPEAMTFKTGEEFDAYRATLLKRIKDG